MAILIDFNQLCISRYAGAQAGSFRQTFSVDLVRHIVLNSIKTSRSRFSQDPAGAETIICCDSSNYWRKELFPYYKGNRSEARKADELIPWESLFEAMDTIRSEIVDVFPWKLVRVERCEADDIISVLSRTFADDMESSIVISSDGDFDQLVEYSPRIRRWNPAARKGQAGRGPIGFAEPKMTLKEKVIRGDTGDCIPNILSDDDALLNPSKRQTPLTKKKIDYFLATSPDEYEDAHRRNWDRNSNLIDLINRIPAEHEKRILSEYDAATERMNNRTGKVFDYLKEHRLMKLLEDSNGLM